MSGAASGAALEAKQAEQQRQCERWVAAAAESGPVQFVLAAMRKRGCDVSPSFFRCVHSPNLKSAGAFAVSEDRTTSILMYYNCLRGERHARETMVHELIHAYDYCRADVRWTDLRHHACTEVRAAALSGDCSFRNEAFRGHLAMFDHHRECVRRRAELSVRMNPHCPGELEAMRAVDAVFDKCYDDKEPFGCIP